MLQSLMKRVEWLERKLQRGFIRLKMPDGTIESIPDDSEAIVGGMVDLIHGRPNSLAQKIGQSIDDDASNKMTNLIRAFFKGPTTREEIEAGGLK